MADVFSGSSGGLSSPAKFAAAVTPNNGADLSVVARALYVGGGGDIAVTMAGGSEVTFQDVPAGSLLPIRVKRVKATGTDATKIIALW